VATTLDGAGRAAADILLLAGLLLSDILLLLLPVLPPLSLAFRRTIRCALVMPDFTWRWQSLLCLMAPCSWSPSALSIVNLLLDSQVGVGLTRALPTCTA
jgi:hypothetical protein